MIRLEPKALDLIGDVHGHATQLHALLIKLVHDDGAGMARLREVVESHLQRFARDETLEFRWQP